MDDSQNSALVEAYFRKSNAFLEWNEARGFTDPLVEGCGNHDRAVSAIIRGDEIHVTRADGKIVVCNYYGNQKRII
jgi:aromatic ring-opening dioxygenase LigB subunit